MTVTNCGRGALGLIFFYWMCSSCSATGPSGGNLTLSAGTQLVDVTGFDGAADPTLPVCAPVGIPNAGKKVETLAKLSGKSGNWQAASVAATDTLEIHFQDANQPGRGGESIVGTVAGRATDARFGDPDNLGPRGVSVNFSPNGSPASLTGVVASTGFVMGSLPV